MLCVCVCSSVCLRRRAGGGGRGALGSRCVTLLPSVCADAAVSPVTAGSQRAVKTTERAESGGGGDGGKLQQQHFMPQANQSQGREPGNKRAEKREQEPEIDTGRATLDGRPRGVCSAK